MLKLEKHTDRHGRTGWYLRDDSGVWVAQIYQTGDSAEPDDVLPTPQEAEAWAQRIIAALTTPAPQPHADDVALVDEFLSAHRSVWANTGDEAERYVYHQEADAARTALLAALSQRRADRDAVIEECARLVERLYTEDEDNPVVAQMDEAFNDGVDRGLSMNEKLRLHSIPLVAAIRALKGK